MKVAAMGVKILFQKNSTVVNNIGNHRSQWADYYECHAAVSGEDGAEDETAGVTVDNADISFTVRFCKAAGAVTVTGFRIVFLGELYDIVAIDHLRFRKRALKFKCRKARR